MDHLVEVIRRYSNRSDLLEQLRKVTVILSNASQDGTGTSAEIATRGVIRSRRLRDRFSRADLQTMVDLYQSGTPARQVAEKFGVSLRGVKRLLPYTSKAYAEKAAGITLCIAEDDMAGNLLMAVFVGLLEAGWRRTAPGAESGITREPATEVITAPVADISPCPLLGRL